jgi:hypothetical protein
MKNIGKIVHIKFIDHSQSPKHCAGPVVCNVFGVITLEDDDHYQITTWAVEQDEEGAAMNDECFSVVKGTILGMRQFTKAVNIKNPNGAKRSRPTDRKR